MARQVAEGYLLVTERTLRRLTPGELDRLGFEIDKLQREVRSTQPPLDDTLALQQRNRRLQRLNSCRQMVEASRRRRRRV